MGSFTNRNTYKALEYVYIIITSRYSYNRQPCSMPLNVGNTVWIKIYNVIIPCPLLKKFKNIMIYLLFTYHDYYYIIICFFYRNVWIYARVYHYICVHNIWTCSIHWNSIIYVYTQMLFVSTHGRTLSHGFP